MGLFGGTCALRPLAVERPVALRSCHHGVPNGEAAAADSSPPPTCSPSMMASSDGVRAGRRAAKARTAEPRLRFVLLAGGAAHVEQFLRPAMPDVRTTSSQSSDRTDFSAPKALLPAGCGASALPRR